MGLFRRSRDRSDAELGGIVLAFASEAEVATIMARAESWARRTMAADGVDPVKEPIRAAKVLREAKPELGLAQVVALVRLGS